MERTTANKVKTQHQLLESQLAAALRAFDGGVAPASRVERLARSLELHLTLEEEHYFPERRASQPDLADTIDELLVEHAELRRSLAEAVEQLAGGDQHAASQALNHYAAIFHRHEKRERDVL
jgi:iron-sulfur cluster repair protein YtfE (RIC family)